MGFVPLKGSDSGAVAENDKGKRTVRFIFTFSPLPDTFIQKKSYIVAIFSKFHMYISTKQTKRFLENISVFKVLD